MGSAYYNEIDPYAAQWLRNLIAAGHIAAGDVDDRDIRLVRPDDLRGYRQCHFFSGVGVWSHALRLAGWPDDREVWTGSCPCQPFSAAGKQEGTTDARHLWPEWFRLIRECRPRVVFGEQVSAAIRHGWLDLVSADLEGLDYSLGAAVMGAHSVGAPHIRQRLYFVADSTGERRVGERLLLRTEEGRRDESNLLEAAVRGAASGMADSEHAERRPQRGPEQDERDGQDAGRQEAHGQSGACGEVCELADSDGWNSSAEGLQRGGEYGLEPQDGGVGAVGDAEQPGLQEQRGQRGVPRGQSTAEPRQTSVGAGASTFWSACRWLPCIDGKARPVEPGTFPLAHGAASRVGRLRAYGNAIVAPQAAEFIRAYAELRDAA